MTYLFSATMIYILTMVIALLIAAIVYLNVQFYNEKKSFNSKLYALQDIIVEISKKQLGQQEQLKLSEELERTVKSTNAKLNDDIFGLNYDLFEIATKNNLI
jgi:predicted Holliday junction resolvase-like endonuclease